MSLRIDLASFSTSEVEPRATRDATGQDVFEHIEMFCTRRRKHTNIGMRSPVDFERQQEVGYPDVRETRD